MAFFDCLFDPEEDYTVDHELDGTHQRPGHDNDEQQGTSYLHKGDCFQATEFDKSFFAFHGISDYNKGLGKRTTPSTPRHQSKSYKRQKTECRRVFYHQIRRVGQENQQKSPLLALPTELIAEVMANLRLSDYISMSESCRMIYEIAKEYLLQLFPYLEKWKHVDSFQALSSAQPCHLVTLQESSNENSLLHVNRAVIYSDSGSEEIRILDLQISPNIETVIGIRAFLQTLALGLPEDASYEIKPLYYSESILSCQLRIATGSFLIALHVSGKVLLLKKIRYDLKLFVRNNDKYLCFGTHNETMLEPSLDLAELFPIPDGWKVFIYDLEERKMRGSAYLLGICGCGVGKETCFQIFEHSLYGASRRILNENLDGGVEQNLITFQLPLDQPRSVQYGQTSRPFLGDQKEWRALQLERCGHSGALQITQCTLDLDGTRWRRTCYRVPLAFPYSGPYEVLRDTAWYGGWDACMRPAIYRFDSALSTFLSLQRRQGWNDLSIQSSKAIHATESQDIAMSATHLRTWYLPERQQLKDLYFEIADVEGSWTHQSGAFRITNSAGFSRILLVSFDTSIPLGEGETSTESPKDVLWIRKQVAWYAKQGASLTTKKPMCDLGR